VVDNSRKGNRKVKILINMFCAVCVLLTVDLASAGRGNPNCDDGPYCEGAKNKEGKLDGAEVCKDSKKVVRRTTEYKNGLRHGQWKCFSEQGKLIETRTYAADKLNGKSTKLQEAINLFEVTTFKDDLKDGEAITYNTSTSNGKETVSEKNVSQYKNNDFHGWVIVYDASGKELRRDCYQDGNLKRDNPELCGAKKK
jgi:antitoxin component YwqK of YwqJK toxin-antitoxin module